MVNVEVKADSIGLLQVNIQGRNFGVFDNIDRDGDLAWFPKRTEQLSGDQIIAIGKALKEANKDKSK